MATLKEIGEFGFINRISTGCIVRPEHVKNPIGDDAAAYETVPGELSLVTTDLLVERVHFLRNAISGDDLGHKAMAVNLSDIAAMGGTARDAFISLAIPEDCDLDYLEAIYDGMKALGRRYNVNILGGDTTGSKADLMISITVIGSVAEAEMLRRDGARPGDVIMTTGPLGGSRAGLHMILNNIDANTDGLRALLAAHVRPDPHLAEGRFLARRPGVHSAIDISDGLTADLGHILERSGVGARLSAPRLPLSDELKAFCAEFGCDPLEFALSGGEDYVLLFTAGRAAAETVASQFQSAFGRAPTEIGEITETGIIEIDHPDGSTETVSPSGWDHFGGRGE